MKVLELLFKGKQITWTQSIIFVILCGMRLAMPISNKVYISMLFSLIIFSVLPIGIWWYIQKAMQFFNSSYICVRIQRLKFDPFFLNVLVNEAITILFVLINALIIFSLSFDFSGVSFILCYGTMVIYWLCIYLVFINVFHFIYYFTREMKSAFFSSYIFLFLLQFTSGYLSSDFFDFDLFDYGRMFQLILGCIAILLCIHLILYFFSKGERDIYDKDKN